MISSSSSGRRRSCQLLASGAARLAVPQRSRDIPAGKVAPAIFLATLSVAVGLVNAACMEG